jgi:hypothetical protein
MLFTIALGSVVNLAVAQSVPKLSDDAYVSILTILPGEPMYSAFGHTAIRVRDDSLGIDAVYNFGTFDFETDWFYLKFLRGLLDYRLARNRFEDVMAAYTEEGRPIIEQRLAFDEPERQVLVLRIENNYLPENRFYRYDFFFDNCTTRPRDVIESVVGAPVLGTEVLGADSFRDLIDPYIMPRPWTDFGIDIVLGVLTDRRATARERLFLPDELMAALATVSVDGEPVTAQTDTLFWPRGYERQQSVPPFNPLSLLVAMLLIGVAVIFTPWKEHTAVRYFDAAVFGFAGIAGLVILVLWFGTYHTVTGSNWNLLWALPTHVVVAVAIIRNRLGTLMKVHLLIAAVLCGLLLATQVVIGQTFHTAVVPLCILLLVRAAYRATSK